MAKNKHDIPMRTPGDLRQISDYYKLNTKAVEDLVTASPENSPPVSEEELRKYRSKSGIRLPQWLKAVLLKAWFAGAVCFFILWGLGIYLPNKLDMLLVFGAALGVVTDLLLNNIFRYFAETPSGNDRWMMLPKRRNLNFFLNILYAYWLLFCVYTLYQVINVGLIAITGAKDTIPLGVEPILFGTFYMAFDMLFIGMKRLLISMIRDAFSTNRKDGSK